MAVPKRRTSKYRKRIRRSHHALKPPGISRCRQCNQPTRPHTVCSNCGHYKNQTVIALD